MPKKNIPIKYTDRDFESIKQSLIEHIKRYYPETFQDFNEASFGSLVLDMVSYVGDVLSFYLDYQANESFLDTAVEYGNIVKLAKQLGYKHREHASSTGIVSFYAIVPAAATGYGHDPDYTPILRRGTELKNSAGVAFLLNQDIDFSKDDNEIVPAVIDNDTGNPTSYAIKTFGQVVSGIVETDEIEIGAYEKLLRVPLSKEGITEIISVYDEEGHQYYEVDYLSQDVIYKEIINPTSDFSDPTVLLRPQSVPRRFTVEQDNNITFLQFGYGSENSLGSANKLVRSADVILKMHGKEYTTSRNFDPSNLNETDKLGVSPANTRLKITYRRNTNINVNAATNTVTFITNPIVEFPGDSLLEGKMISVINSLECNNEEPIIGQVSRMSAAEIKRHAIDTYSSQNRAVTAQDYESVVYRMPPKYGRVVRCGVMQDTQSLKRNLNIYVVSKNSKGFLTQTTQTIKQNLKFWINNYKMLNDTIDILDAKIVNVGVDFSILGEDGYEKFEVLDYCKAQLSEYFSTHFDVGEPLYITKLHKILKNVDGVLDVKEIRIKSKFGSGYSTAYYDVETSMSDDGRILYIPRDSIFEIKYRGIDIVGTII